MAYLLCKLLIPPGCPPMRTQALEQMMANDPTLICCRIGDFAEGDCSVQLQHSGAMHRFWDGSHALTGFGCVR